MNLAILLLALALAQTPMERIFEEELVKAGARVAPIRAKLGPCSDACGCGCKLGLPCTCRPRVGEVVTPAPVPVRAPISQVRIPAGS